MNKSEGRSPRGGDIGSTSTTLIREAKQHVPEGWQKLIDRYGPLVYGWCRETGLQESDSADVMQEVFQAVMKSIDGFQRDRPDDSFRGWLWTITRNKVRDFHRRNSTRPQAFGGTDYQERVHQMPDPFESLSESLPGTPENGFVRSALDQIRPEFEEHNWKAFWRLTIDGDRSAEIAADLGMTANAVRQAKYRVLRRLRRAIESPEDEA